MIFVSHRSTEKKLTSYCHLYLYLSKQPAAASAVPGSAFGFMNATPSSPVPPAAQATPTSPVPKSFDPLLNSNAGGPTSPNPNNINPTMAQMQHMQMAQMQMAYQQNMMMMQQMQMAGFQRQGSTGSGGGVPMMPGTTTASKQPIMGANYMKQVPGVSGDKMSSFSFLGSDPRKEDNHSFDFVQDAMKNEKK